MQNCYKKGNRIPKELLEAQDGRLTTKHIQTLAFVQDVVRENKEMKAKLEEYEVQLLYLSYPLIIVFRSVTLYCGMCDRLTFECGDHDCHITKLGTASRDFNRQIYTLCLQLDPLINLSSGLAHPLV